MTLPQDRQVYQDELADYWLDDEGILCSISKPGLRTVEKLKATYDLIDKITEGRSVCLLSDTNLTGSRADEARDYAFNESLKRFKAMAMIADNTFSKLLINTFINLSGQPIPMRLFSNEADARNWLKQFVD